MNSLPDKEIEKIVNWHKNRFPYELRNNFFKSGNNESLKLGDCVKFKGMPGEGPSEFHLTYYAFDGNLKAYESFEDNIFIIKYVGWDGDYIKIIVLQDLVDGTIYRDERGFDNSFLNYYELIAKDFELEYELFMKD